MANFENGFHEKHAVKVDERKLSEKFYVVHTPEGSTPDGYHVYESLTIETGKGTAVSIYPDGEATYTTGLNETESSMVEHYTMLGIDTDSNEFKQFQTDIQKPENYNAQTVEKMLETVPQLTAEKQVERLNAIHFEQEAEFERKKQAEADKKNEFMNSKFMTELGKALDSKEIKDFQMVDIQKGQVVTNIIESFDSKVLQERASEIYDQQSWINDKEEMNKAVLDSINVDLKRQGYEKISITELALDNEKELADFKNNFVNSEIVKNLAAEVENKGFTKEQIHELAEETWDKQVGLSDNELEQVFVEKTNEQLVEKGYEPIDYQSLKDKENSLSNESANLSFEDDIDYAEEFYKHNKPMTEEEMAYDEFIELDNDSDITIENHFDNQLKDFERNLQKTKTELAEPGRQYTGEITSIDEERTTQVTKSGVTIIHETQNLPGIQEKEVGKSVKIDYANGKEATIEDKSSGLERGKEAKLEHDHQAERSHDSGDHDHDIPF